MVRHMHGNTVTMTLTHFVIEIIIIDSYTVVCRFIRLADTSLKPCSLRTSPSHLISSELISITAIKSFAASIYELDE